MKMLKVAVGHSEQIDAEDIMEEIVEQVEERLDGLTPQAGLMFAAVDFEYEEILSAIQEKWPGVQIIGCTTDGELTSQLGFAEDSISLALFASDTIDITTGVGRNVSQDIGKAAQEAVAQAKEGTTKDPAFAIITPVSLTTSSEQIVMSFREALGSDTMLFGANAADQWQLKETTQFYGGEAVMDAVPLILFSGPVVFSGGVHSGWKPIGKSGKVTKAEANTVFEIDGAPALEFYKNLLGPEAIPTGDRPLAVLTDEGGIACLRASVEQYDPETGSVTFFGDIAEGATVQITVANRNEILEGTRASVQQAHEAFPSGKTPDAAIFFSCAGRKLLLGTKTEEEYTILKEELGGEDIPAIGFYGYGEIGPAMEGDAGCEFHNETFVTVLIGSE